MKNNQRRRVLKVMALSTSALIMPHKLLAKKAELHSWHGNALGAQTSIQLYHDDKQMADQILAHCVKIISKYEKAFSLFDENSEVSRLNKNGWINNASDEFVMLTKLSKQFNEETNGAFDISIQPLWELYEKHFQSDEGSNLPNNIDQTIDKVGSENIIINNSDVILEKEGMGLSFNGIAQGFITDKVTEFLSQKGFANTLIDMGEYRAGGAQASGEPWRIGLLDPFDAVSIADVIEMKTGAVATSGGYGNIFDLSGKHHHIFNPSSGLSSNLYASVTVRASDATTADALSTAFSNMKIEEIKTILQARPDVEVRLTFNSGEVTAITSS